MAITFKKVAADKQETAEEAFRPSGQALAGGGVRYKVFCDGGINPSGVYWSKTVPAGASTEDYKAAEAERDEAISRLRELTGAA